MPYPWEVRRRIAALERLDLSAMDVGTILEECRGLIYAGYTTTGVRIRPGEILYRARICDKPESLKCIYYPPRDKATLGRFNEAESSVFYGSAHMGATLPEVHATADVTVAISTWHVVEPIALQVVGFTDAALRRLGVDYRLPYDFQTSVDGAKTKSDRLLTEYLAAKVTEDVVSENSYKLTAALARMLIGQNGAVDGLIYPAIAVAGNAHNVAIRAASADRALRFKSVRFSHIDAVEGQQYKLSHLDAAKEIDEDGVIKWKGRDFEWKMKHAGTLLIFERASTGWIARDSVGRIIEPD